MKQDGYQIVSELVSRTVKQTAKHILKSTKRDLHPIKTLMKARRAGRIKDITKQKDIAKYMREYKPKLTPMTKAQKQAMQQLG